MELLIVQGEGFQIIISDYPSKMNFYPFYIAISHKTTYNAYNVIEIALKSNTHEKVINHFIAFQKRYN